MLQFRQPLEKVPRDVIGRYVSDRASQAVVLSKFSVFVDLVGALMDRNLCECVCMCMCV